MGNLNQVLNEIVWLIDQIIEKNSKENDSKDPLTNLLSRRYVDSILKREVEVSMKQKQPFSVMMIDLDDFKSINDTYGHDAGDFVLNRVSQTLQENLRSSDVLARVGGDEFQVLVPDQDHEHCEKLIEKLRMALEGLEMEYKGHSLSISSSFGVATFGVDGKDLITLERHADETMYADKKRRKMGR